MALSALQHPAALLCSQGLGEHPSSMSAHALLLPSCLPHPAFPGKETQPGKKGPGSRTLGHISACAYHTSSPIRMELQPQGSCCFVSTRSANLPPAQKAKNAPLLSEICLFFSVPKAGICYQWSCFPGRSFQVSYCSHMTKSPSPHADPPPNQFSPKLIVSQCRLLLGTV